MQSVKECYLCRKDAGVIGYYRDLPSEGLEKHHVIYGTANRRLSDQTGLWVWLCKKHHNEDHGAFAVHFNSAVREELCKDAERAYLRSHSFEEWMSTFMKNYLDEDEINRIKTKAEHSLQNGNAVTERDLEDLGGENRIKTKPPKGFIFLEGYENE